MNIRIENEPCKKLHIKETLKVRYEIDVTAVDKDDTQNQRYFTGTGISSDPKDAKLYTSIDDAKADFKNVPNKFNGSVIRDVRVARRFVNITEPNDVTESFDNANYLNNDNCLGYAIQLRNMNTGYIDLLCYNTKDLATQNLTIAELMDNETNYDADVYEDDFNTIYSTADNIIEEIDFRRDLENGKIYGEKNALVYGNDDGFYVVINKIPVDLYF